MTTPKETPIERMYERVAPMVDEMRAGYPRDAGIDGFEPALTQDIAEICLKVLDGCKRGEFAYIEGKDASKLLDLEWDRCGMDDESPRGIRQFVRDFLARNAK